MASVNASDIPEIQQFMNPLWTAIKKFYGVELTEEYSKEIYDYLNDLGNQYPHPLCRELIIGLMKYAEKEQNKLKMACNGVSENE